MLWSPRKHARHKRPLETEEEESDDKIIVEEAATSEDDQEMEVLGPGAKCNLQFHNDEAERQVEEEYTELGEDHRNQDGAESESGRAIGCQGSKQGMSVELVSTDTIAAIFGRPHEEGIGGMLRNWHLGSA